MSDELSKAVDNIADTVKEGVHKTSADSERAKRATVGDAMTPGEKASSIVHEAGDELKAGIDHTKRNVRDST